MILLITIILVFMFLLNLIIYWLIYLTVKDKNNTSVKFFSKLFPIIWFSTLIVIPVINSSLLRIYFPENLSYFNEYWNLFALLGIAFIIIGINFAKKAGKVNKVKLIEDEGSKLITSGIFKIIRHPFYSGCVIFFFGASFISDSFISLILCPFIYIILEIHSLLEEKLILIPNYGEKYEKFKDKTPSRIIPTPLNFLLIIIAVIIVYVGFLNIS